MRHLLLYIILLLTVVFVYSAHYPMRIHKRVKRITDNQYAGTTTNHIPYLVRLDYVDGSGEHFLCSGVLLHPKLVLTAAHCVSELSMETITVSSNLPYIEHRRITNTYTPRDYGENFKDYDIAILRVDPPFQTDNLYVKPIKPYLGDLKSGDELQISGCKGRTVESTYMPWQQCAKYYNGKVNITRSMFCGVPKIYPRTCSRDTGGPVVHKGKLCGILQWSSGWIDSSYPEVYMSTKSVIRFIQEVSTSI